MLFSDPVSIEILPPQLGLHDCRRASFEALRYRVYVQERGWERHDDADPHHRACRESDRFDAVSTYVVATIGGLILGGCRVIDGRRSPLPFEEFVAEPHGLADPAEISRMIIHGRTVRERKALGLALYPAISRYLQEARYAHLCGTLRSAYFKHLNAVYPGAFRALPGTIAEHGRDQFVPFCASVARWARFFEDVNRRAA